MNTPYINTITNADCRDHLLQLDDSSIDMLLSDIPYGISLDDWDVLHNNTNSALLGQSPAQLGQSAFRRRGKPINGWARSDRDMGREYQEWCESWCTPLFGKMRKGASLFVFGARRTIHRVINAFEDAGFLLKDTLAWRKPSAHHRAQRISVVYERRGLTGEAEKWKGWRVGNLAPAYEPIAWFVKPYKIGGTIADNILQNCVGAMNVEGCLINGSSPTNVLDFGFGRNEVRVHEAQKPLALIEFLMCLTTVEEQLVLDPFMGSGTTAVAAIKLKRNYIGFEIAPDFHAKSLQRIDAALGTTYLGHGTAHQPALFEKPAEYETHANSLQHPSPAVHNHESVSDASPSE